MAKLLILNNNLNNAKEYIDEPHSYSQEGKTLQRNLKKQYMRLTQPHTHKWQTMQSMNIRLNAFPVNMFCLAALIFLPSIFTAIVSHFVGWDFLCVRLWKVVTLA